MCENIDASKCLNWWLLTFLHRTTLNKIDYEMNLLSLFLIKTVFDKSLPNDFDGLNQKPLFVTNQSQLRPDEKQVFFVTLSIKLIKNQLSQAEAQHCSQNRKSQSSNQISVLRNYHIWLSIPCVQHTRCKYISLWLRWCSTQCERKAFGKRVYHNLSHFFLALPRYM